MSNVLERPIQTQHLAELEPWEILENRKVYRCAVVICPEREGGFSVYAEELPGAASQGNTVDEAVQNITEALTAVVQRYLERTSEIPWDKSVPKRPKNAVVRWIDVNA